jgi:hypothetical protein
MSMTFENVQTEWFDENALRLPDYKVGRVNFGRGRSYIRINEGGQLESPLRLYTSLTTAISSCAPMEKPLLEWHCKHGLQESERLTKVAQMYGTLMHLEIGKFLKDKVYDFDTTEAVVEDYTSEHSYWEVECKDWAMKLKYDMAAFIQFFIDYEVVPLGIEYVLLSDKGFGTLIDLVCKITVDELGDWGEVYKSGDREGQVKLTKARVQKTAIINFKSGRKGFFRSNGIQIECERELWEENFPDMPIDMAMNWAPNEWIENPGYHIKDWKGDICQEEIDAVLMLANVRYASKAQNKSYLNITGVVSTAESLYAALNRESIAEYCNRKFSSMPGAEKQFTKTRQLQSVPVSKTA